MATKNVFFKQSGLGACEQRIVDADMVTLFYNEIIKRYETGDKFIVEIENERFECEVRKYDEYYYLGNGSFAGYDSEVSTRESFYFEPYPYTDTLYMYLDWDRGDLTVLIYTEDNESNPWETIVANGGADYQIGDYVMLDLGTIDGVDCGSVRMCKVAEGEDGTASTWLALDSLKTYMDMNSTATASGGWEQCERRAWLNGAFFNGLPEYIREAIAPTTRYSLRYDGGVANDSPTVDHVWIPSVTEICTSNPLYKQETQGTYYAAIDAHVANRKLTLGYEGTVYRWWHRTVSSANQGSAFRGTAATGSAPGSGASAANMGGIVIGFSIKAPDTATYRWKVQDNALVSVGKNDNPITTLAGSIVNSVFDNARYALATPFNLRHDKDWALEWRMNGPVVSAGMVKIWDETGENAVNGTLSIAARSATESVSFARYINDGKKRETTHYGVQLGNHNINYPDDHLYRLQNIVNANGTNVIWLYIDGVKVAPMNHSFSANSDYGKDVWAFGNDFTFGFMGSTQYPLSNFIVDDIAVWESGASEAFPEEQPEISRGTLYLLYKMFSPAVFHALTGKQHWMD